MIPNLKIYVFNVIVCGVSPSGFVGSIEYVRDGLTAMLNTAQAKARLLGSQDF